MLLETTRNEAAAFAVAFRGSLDNCMWNQISELWCKKMHSKAMWPIHGKYVCPDCLREYPVVWAEIPPLRLEQTQPEAYAAPQGKPAFHQLTGMFKRLGTM